MNCTRVLSHRTPRINFIGKRVVPESIDHTPRVHPASPSSSLPSSFKQYREAIANQHGPLATRSASSKTFFSINLRDGEVSDRSELPKRFGRLSWSPKEINAVETGGASLLAWSLTLLRILRTNYNACLRYSPDREGVDILFLPGYPFFFFLRERRNQHTKGSSTKAIAGSRATSSRVWRSPLLRHVGGFV